ncbi:MAG: chemotaxis protein CheB [bacterium]|nr:chemotaxis protein CheB [bacterium]
MAKRDLVVIGASAGGVEALKHLISHLPDNFPATICIVLHVNPHGTSVMPQILARVGKMKAYHPRNHTHFETSCIYIAPPNHHLIVKRGFLRVILGPKENGHRPAIDVLFRTAARCYSSRVIGVILSGTLDDGTAGLWKIKERGGLAVVQDPADAFYPGMPQSAIDHVKVDYIRPLAEIAPLLERLVQEDVTELLHEEVEQEDIAEMDKGSELIQEPGGKPSLMMCPECGGVMREYEDGDIIRYRCHTGHGFTADTLMAEHAQYIEEAMWTAIRTLEDQAVLLRRLAERAERRGSTIMIDRYRAQAQDVEEKATQLRNILMGGLVSERPESLESHEER